MSKKRKPSKKQKPSFKAPAAHRSVEPVTLDDPAGWIQEIDVGLVVAVLVGRRQCLERDAPVLVGDHGPAGPAVSSRTRVQTGRRHGHGRNADRGKDGDVNRGNAKDEARPLRGEDRRRHHGGITKVVAK